MGVVHNKNFTKWKPLLWEVILCSSSRILCWCVSSFPYFAYRTAPTPRSPFWQPSLPSPPSIRTLCVPSAPISPSSPRTGTQNARLDTRQRPRVVHSEARRQLVADLVRRPVVLHALADPSIQCLRGGPHDVGARSVIRRRRDYYSALREWEKRKKKSTLSIKTRRRASA